MYTERANLHKQIAESQRIIREKFKKFKKGEHDIEDNITKTLKPIIQPLNKLVDNSAFQKNRRLNIRHSTPQHSDIDEDVSNETFQNPADKTFNISEKDDDSFNEMFDSDGESNILDHNDPELTEDLTNDEKVQNNIPLNTEKLVNRYINLVRRKDSRVDQVLGVRKLRKGFKLGDSSFTYNNTFFKIRGNQYKITPGLTELIFNKNPNEFLITDDDKKIYRNIILTTSANKKRYKPNQSIRKNLGIKFIKFLKSTVKGEGFKVAKRNDVTEYIYWDDPNELVDRLKLLDAERAAGNNNHNNEIQNIIEELSERGFI